MCRKQKICARFIERLESLSAAGHRENVAVAQWRRVPDDPLMSTKANIALRERARILPRSTSQKEKDGRRIIPTEISRHTRGFRIETFPTICNPLWQPTILSALLFRQIVVGVARRESETEKPRVCIPVI